MLQAKQAANEVSWFHSFPRLAAPLICPSRFNISLCQRCKLFLFVQEYTGAVGFSKGNGKIPSWKQRVRTFIAIDSCAPNAKNGLQIFVQFFSRWSSVSKMVTGAKLGPPRSEKSVVAQSRLVGIRRTAVKAHQDKATAQVEEVTTHTARCKHSLVITFALVRTFGAHYNKKLLRTP